MGVQYFLIVLKYDSKKYLKMWVQDYVKCDYMSPVSSVFYTEITVIIWLYGKKEEEYK